MGMDTFGTPKANTALELVPGKKGAKICGPDGAVHYLNQTAAAVWLLADGTRDVDTIAGQIAGLFGLDDPPTQDVREALGALMEKGLLQAGG